MAERAQQLAQRQLLPAALVFTIALMTVNTGGFHPRHWIPVALLAFGVALAGLMTGRMPALRSIAGIGIAAGALLAVLSMASVGWAVYSGHLAWDEANRTLMYTAVFAIGASWLAVVRTYMSFLGWLGAASAALVGWLLLQLATLHDSPVELFVGGRLDWPIGYSNATAALAAIAMWVLIGLGVEAHAKAMVVRRASPADGDSATQAGAPDTPVHAAWWVVLAGLMTGAATGALALVVLAESRGAMLAMIVAVVVAMIMVPRRGILITHLAVVFGLVAIGWNRLTEPFVAITDLIRAAGSDDGDAAAALVTATDSIREAGSTALLHAAIAAGLIAVAAVVSRQLAQRDASRYWMGIAATAGIVVVVLAVGIVGASRADSIQSWTSSQLDACGTGTTEPGEGDRSRIAAVGSNRCDFWRVAVDTWQDHPVLGAGANNFQGPYVLKRNSSEQPRQAHSLPLDVLAGTGIVGGLLLLTWFGVIVAGAVKFVRSGPARSAAFAGAIAAIGYWMAHATLDWLWNIPAVTVTVLLLAGGVAGIPSARQQPLAKPAAIPIGLGVALLAVLSLVPQWRADQAYRDAREPGATPERQFRTARSAAEWDPTWAAPVILQATSTLADGNINEAATLANEAIEREPNNWAIRLQAARVFEVTLESDERARREYEAAAALNPQYEVPEAFAPSAADDDAQ